MSPSVEYSSENPAESTADLITRTLAALPEYPGTWAGTCSAYRNLSPDESSYSVRRYKWRLSHPPTGTGYLKVWLRRKFQPEGGGSPTYTDLTAYEWTGSGNPCLADPTKAYTDEENKITSSPTTENEPATDGTVTIEIVKFSCVAGYEPDISDDENPQPDGFPDPAWTA